MNHEAGTTHRKMSVSQGNRKMSVSPGNPCCSGSMRNSVNPGSKRMSLGLCAQHCGYGGISRKITLGQRGISSNDEWDMYGRKQGPSTLENTYHMAPQPHEKFNSCTARRVMEDLLRRHIGGDVYDAFHCRNLSKSLATTIVQLMKDQGFSRRYKYVCYVTIGQKKPSQTMRVCSRCVWDAKNDNYASASYDKDDIFAVAILFAAYRE